MLKIFTLVMMLSSVLFGNVGIVKKMTGKVQVKRAKELISLRSGSFLKNGDVLLTKAKSSVGLVFDDGTRISFGENAIFIINKFKVEPNAKESDVDLKLEKGKASFSSGKVGKIAPESVKFRIPQGVIGIRGTKFVVEVK
ncbi:MAG: Unknown protein [uncultured Sulfurovum sp.]|uniref:FecR protein domain-containing protein n=1 Tax=uncultured Sulfurovum sp. TaxID=269237 RepID=A0A6S6SQ96_9BACT|nr:MAG: Unknown protein [uncultured Sulfurovum sp.]